MIRLSLVLLTGLYAAILFAGCSEKKEQPQTATTDRFADTFKDITAIADVRRLTELKRDIQPFFSPSGERIYFTRLIINSASDVDSSMAEHVENYFSIDFNTGQLYVLQEIPSYPKINIVPPDSLPSLLSEIPEFGIHAGPIIYFSMFRDASCILRNIYSVIGDSLTQLTYGDYSSMLQDVSPDNRFVAFLYDQRHFSVIIYDSKTGDFYDVPKSRAETNRHDLMPIFSPDSRKLVFLRSGDLYNEEYMPFGDIWIVEIKDDKL
jgi:hypothetical protein